MYQKLYRVAMEHDKPVEVNAKGETQAMNTSFGKKIIFPLQGKDGSRNISEGL